MARFHLTRFHLDEHSRHAKRSESAITSRGDTRWILWHVSPFPIVARGSRVERNAKSLPDRVRII